MPLTLPTLAILGSTSSIIISQITATTSIKLYNVFDLFRMVYYYYYKNYY